MKKNVNWKVLIICLIVVYAVAGIGSFFTSSSVNSGWYQTIKPSITPPNYVFPVVWNVLFFLVALSLYFSWIKATKKEKKKITFVFGANFLLNILWSILYFGMQKPNYAFFELIVLWFSVLSMILITWKISKKSAWLLVPYFVWISFAGVLNYFSAF